MLVYLCILLTALLIYFALQVRKNRRIFKELLYTVKERKHFLHIDSPNTSTFRVLKELESEINQLIDEQFSAAEIGEKRLEQLENIYSNIQNLILIIGNSNEILLANTATQRMLQELGESSTHRIDTIFHSTELLETLNTIRAGNPVHKKEIVITIQNQEFWFELFGTSISYEPQEDVKDTNEVLIILHDITQLKILENIRKEFVSNVSHELRTPVTIVKGYIDTLLEDGESMNAETKKTFLKKSKAGIDRLNLLIEELLQLSRIESGNAVINIESNSIKAIYTEISDHFSSRLKEGQSIQIEVESNAEMAQFDKLKMTQVIENLVQNAINYADPFSLITLKAKSDGASIICAVQDDGIGIEEKHLPHIFERFYRVDPSRSRETGGTGLGLSIVKHIIKLHQGEISAESQIGQGTRILFTLPKEA